MIREKGYETYIFDLGEVIIDLDIDRVIVEINKHTKKEPSLIRKIIIESEELRQHEKGLIDDNHFYLSFNHMLDIEISYERFKDIWNSMLKYLNPVKINLLKELSNEAQVLILSNTNGIHISHFNDTVRKITGGEIITDFIHYAHYSHLMGMRKPDENIYQAVIDQHNLIPERSVFFDDRRDNIEAAKKLGFAGVQITHSDHILEIFND